MAESDPIKRLQAAARRTTTPDTVESQHRWYMDELEQTIGRDPSGIGSWRTEFSTSPSWLGPTLKILALSAMTFAATIVFLLWQDGTLGRFFGSKQILPPHKKVVWVLGDAETGQAAAVPTGKATKSDAPPNEIEPLINPQVAPAVATPEPDKEVEN
ncbi:hypothetical protein [Aquisediminimonas profunda]|uniref:hypothetical protein n=1 Tax=Aquisediminimonas profunda TaxID=1550733 RepID=UPI001C62B71E|nr:hypothetical protein [Aquisediminimonas profunda]